MVKLGLRTLVAMRVRTLAVALLLQLGNAIGANSQDQLATPPGDAARGESIVTNRQVGLCLLCHSAPAGEPRVQGNLAPGHMVSGGQELVEAAQRVVRAFAGGPHIFNLGHGITPDADPDNVALMIETVRA